MTYCGGKTCLPPYGRTDFFRQQDYPRTSWVVSSRYCTTRVHSTTTICSVCILRFISTRRHPAHPVSALILHIVAVQDDLLDSDTELQRVLCSVSCVFGIVSIIYCTAGMITFLRYCTTVGSLSDSPDTEGIQVDAVDGFDC